MRDSPDDRVNPQTDKNTEALGQLHSEHNTSLLNTSP